MAIEAIPGRRVRAHPGSSAVPTPTPPRTRRWWRDTSAAALWALLLGVVALWVSGGGLQHLGDLAGALTSLGRLTGLIASALLLVQVFAMARVPWCEKAWGQDGLTSLHRGLGFASVNLMVAHIVLIVAGYAAGTGTGFWATLLDVTLDYPGMLLAAAGTVALGMVAGTSVRAARDRMRYESWHLIHLYGYLGAGLALPHQLWTGQDFLASPVATVFWWTLYSVCVGAVLVYRVATPLWRSLRAPIRVVGVRHESPTTTSVTVGGPGVARLRVAGGQFFQWRFLAGPGWTRANPYSLSAAPDGRTLTFTAAEAASRHAGVARRSLWTTARRGPHPPQGAADGRRYRYHPCQVAAGVVVGRTR
jgi:DMSO/TMAO reductase YedYZ heme-binding membrane subunit